MCTNCLTLPTKSSYIFSDRPQPFFQSFPCGQCADCQRRKKSEWRVRAYYEALSTFNQHGFCLFDTLTYSDKNLRHFHDVNSASLYNCWDFSCFFRPDIQRFFKRLRKNLKSAGFDPKGKVRYLLTSEYGTSEFYKGRRCTHRPHYHILFFVTLDIDPWQFSKFIGKSWEDRTDGYPWKSRNYVMNNRVFSWKNQDCTKLINYVTKYVTKDMFWYRKLYKRVYISYTLTNPDWSKSYKGRLAFNRFKNSVLPFHLQSRGFGLSALDIEDSEYISKFNAIRMPVSKGVIASVPLSTYYKRKLYYDCVWFNGKVMWLPKSEYYQNRLNRFASSVNALAQRLNNFDMSLGLEKSKDLAIYQLLWKGVLAPRECLLMSDQDFLRWRFLPRKFPFRRSYSGSYKLPIGTRCYFNFSSGESSFLHGSVISDNYIRHVRSGRGVVRNFNPVSLHDDDFHSNYGRVWSPLEFGVHPPDDMVLIDDSKLPRFAGYDSLLDRYNAFVAFQGCIDDKSQYDHDRNVNHYTQLGLFD